MKLIELQKYDNYSVILRQDDNGNNLPTEPFVVACMPTIREGEVVEWTYGHYARTKTARYHPNFYRLEEIASKVIDGLIQDDESSAYEYLANEVEIDSHEAEYFGLNFELVENFKI